MFEEPDEWQRSLARKSFASIFALPTTNRDELSLLGTGERPKTHFT